MTEDTALPTTPPYPSSAIITNASAANSTNNRISLRTSIALRSSSASISASAFVLLADCVFLLPVELLLLVVLLLLCVLFFLVVEAISSVNLPYLLLSAVTDL